MMKPLFKWTGGKNRMFDYYAPHFFPTDDFDTFVDSFCVVPFLINLMWPVTGEY